MPPDRVPDLPADLPVRLLLARLGPEPVVLPGAAHEGGAWRVGRAAGLLVGSRVRAAR